MNLSSMWDTRPQRIPKKQGGKAYVAGVCEGIAVRFQIDPTLPRVLFVITTLFYGGGIVAYLLAWGLMPLLTKKTSPFDEVLRKSTTNKSEEHLGYWLILIVGIVVTAGIRPLLSEAAVSSWLTIALFAGAWYLLYQRQPQPPVHVDMSVYQDPSGAPLPPRWNPLGVAPDLWDLPEPDADPVKTSAPKWPGIVAMIAAGAIVLGLVTAGPTLRSPNDDALASVSLAPQSVNDLQPRYSVSLGRLELDLRGITDWDAPRTVTVNVELGDAEIYLPEGIPLQVECNTDLGTTDCIPRRDPDAKLILIVNNELGDARIIAD